MNKGKDAVSIDGASGLIFRRLSAHDQNEEICILSLSANVHNTC